MITTSAPSEEITAGWQGFGAGKGVVSFWVKPSYRPATTGKIRNLFDFSRYHEDCAAFGIHRSPFGAWFLPMQTNGPTPQFRQPKSLLWAASIPADDVLRGTNYGGEIFGFGRFAPTVNSLGTPQEATNPTVFDAGRWTLVTLVWELRDPVTSSSGSGANIRLYANGQLMGTMVGSDLGKFTLWYHDPIELTTTTTSTTTTAPDGTVTTIDTEVTTIRGTKANSVRLGSPSQVCSSQGSHYGGNFPADATFDEFFCWNDTTPGLAGAQTLWTNGRYAASGLNGDGWKSANINLTGGIRRQLPPASSAAVPTGPGLTTPASPVLPTVTGSQVKLLGVSWTWHGEETLAYSQSGQTTLKRVLYNYATPLVGTGAFANWSGFPNTAPRPQGLMEIGCDVSIIANGTVVATATDDQYTKLNYAYDPATTTLNYGVRFRTVGTGATASAILLATPVFDDVTIYWTGDETSYIEYHTILMR